MHVSPKKATSNDGHSFILPETFFSYSNLFTFTFPSSASFSPSDNDPTLVPATATGAVFRLSRPSRTTTCSTFFLIQFVRPNVWRFRFDPSKKSASEYTDYNSRTIIVDKLTTLRKHLDDKEGLAWGTSVTDSGEFYSLQVLILRTNRPDDDQGKHTNYP